MLPDFPPAAAGYGFASVNALARKQRRLDANAFLDYGKKVRIPSKAPQLPATCRLSRRQWLRFGAYATLAAAPTYGFLVERHWLETTTTRLAVDLGPEGPRALRVALLSDLHYDPLLEGDYIQEVVRLTYAARPDLILLLGDFVDYHAEAARELGGILARLEAPLGVLGILGNHDLLSGASRVLRILEGEGINMLRNRIVRMDAGDGRLLVTGLDSALHGQPRPDLLATVRTHERVLLAHHEPDSLDCIQHDLRGRVAMQVSGHTHGGQICAPGGIVLKTASLGNRYTRGLYRPWPGSGTALYVTRGIGTTFVHARAFCRPEIALMDLTNSSRTAA